VLCCVVLDCVGLGWYLGASKCEKRNQSTGHFGGDGSLGEEIDHRHEKGHTNGSAKESMGPLHVVNRLELLQRHAAVQPTTTPQKQTQR